MSLGILDVFFFLGLVSVILTAFISSRLYRIAKLLASIDARLYQIQIQQQPEGASTERQHQENLQIS